MTDAAYLDAFVGVSQTKARYCRTLDAKDWDAFAQLFTEDLVLDVQGVEPIHGRDNALAFIKDALATATTVHQVHVPEVELVADGEARVIWAMQDRNTWDPPRNGVSTQRGYGQYHETYIRHDGRWKIARQKLVYLQLDINRD